jgi:hypothetical protein
MAALSPASGYVDNCVRQAHLSGCFTNVMSTNQVDVDYHSPVIHAEVSPRGDIHHFLGFIHDFIPALSTGMMG